MDAAQLLMMAERIASLTGRRPMPAMDMSWRQAAGISQAMLAQKPGGGPG
jgi:hypothetical protein